MNLVFFAWIYRIMASCRGFEVLSAELARAEVCQLDTVAAARTNRGRCLTSGRVGLLACRDRCIAPGDQLERGWEGSKR